MSVARFEQPNFLAQDAASYKAALDAAIMVLARLGAGFAPRAEDTPGMKVAVDAGAVFDRASGGFTTQAAQLSATITAPGSNAKIVRLYVDQAGVVGKVEGTAAASPVAPSYPANVFPVCQVTIASGTTAITNAMITDERAWSFGFGTPRNTVLWDVGGSAGTLTKPANARFYRVTMAGAGASGGGGATNAGGTSHAGGGGGGAGASIINRLWAAENLNSITIGSGGAAVNGGAADGSNGTDGNDGSATSFTGVSTGATLSCAAGVKGLKATAATPTAGAGGAGGAAGTGVAGGAGAAGTAGASGHGGKGGDVGTSGSLAVGGAGGTISPAARLGVAGTKGSGGGGGVGTGGASGMGGAGFVLIEIF